VRPIGPRGDGRRLVAPCAARFTNAAPVRRCAKTLLRPGSSMQRGIGLCLPELAFAAEAYRRPVMRSSASVRRLGQTAAPAAGRERPPRGRGADRAAGRGWGSCTPQLPAIARLVEVTQRQRAPPPYSRLALASRSGRAGCGVAQVHQGKETDAAPLQQTYRVQGKSGPRAIFLPIFGALWRHHVGPLRFE
jgi:hypothetical protein